MPDATQKIKVLAPEEARRIAAGEVIDRPSALVREFIDNAIDAGGRLIELIIEEGGIRRTEVVDDGEGMGRDDLELCWLPHATSKIRCLDDLKTAVTLGFRGEALAAAAAVSRLEILSSRDGREAWKLAVSSGGKPFLEQVQRRRGTSVRSLGLYDTIPARKRFLKRAGSEAISCRQIFNEKALALPALSFRFTQDGVLKSFLPSAGSLKERFASVFLDERETPFLHEISCSGNGFSAAVVAGGPELSRQDRRLQFIFANSRRIQDFALLQAFEYGLQGFFPGGSHPLGAVFITIDPSRADFNIHPAKREVRFEEPGAIHHALVSALRDFSRRFYTAAAFKSEAPQTGGFTAHKTSYSQSDRLAMEALLSHPPEFAPLPGREGIPAERLGEGIIELSARDDSPYRNSQGGGAWAAEEAANYTAENVIPGSARYLGRLFGLFILIEKNEKLFIIDQHAAHERILYDHLIQGPIAKQELLVSMPFVTDSSEDDRFLEERSEELAKLGIVIRRSDGEWLIEALPAGWKLSGNKTVAEILNLKDARENLAERWTATLACHTAVKDGDYLDEKTALDLAEAAFALPVRRCPHGRPIWFELSRTDLLKAVKRTL